MSKSDNERRQITTIHLHRYQAMTIRLRNVFEWIIFLQIDSHSSYDLESSQQYLRIIPVRNFQ